MRIEKPEKKLRRFINSDLLNMLSWVPAYLVRTSIDKKHSASHKEEHDQVLNISNSNELCYTASTIMHAIRIVRMQLASSSARMAMGG
jgi:hypothetical protein